MSNELRAVAPAGNTVEAHILNPSARLWNGSAFEAYSSGNYPDYAVTMTEQGSSGVYVGSFPTAISDAGDYEVIYYLRSDPSVSAEGDQVVGTGTIKWDGSAVVTEEDASVGEMSGTNWLAYILRTFKRTDKTEEVFDATNAAVAEIRRKFRTARDEKETAMTDTIDTLGEYKLDVESDFGMAVSDVFVRGSNNGFYLTPISKSRYDDLYGKWGTGSSQRGLPRDYCLFGGQVLLGPIPDSIDYVYVQSYGRARLTPADEDSSAIPYTTDDYKEIMGYGVLWRLYKLVENDDQAGAYKALWDDGLDQIKTLERRNRRVTTIVAYTDC